ncbi:MULTISPECIES: flagellar hook-basal body complex protein FliE [unclassified Nocardioides]|jgi:flagellar hook-basal body complex protein FliE|uniref:flagellar hook-basal body complex protein FliE n=1 Tax=unclassified Nocardioides TaxID=2615069 RepID=UPI0007027378|nr:MULTISPECIES: flagellar hook-basal body complex protein FliE [unclassified Nocardioides]KRC52615.1 flagellar hook-basal body protein FliE [Nocardioides sp. Root79]KRC72147.1 flagellar hook-basal body protein FliE [Nocardioides sp. Root240]
MDISPLQFPTVAGSAAVNPAMALSPSTAVQAPAGTDTEFGSMVLDGLDRLEGLTDKADGLAVQAATGKLENIHDYTIAASEASVASQLTVALRNKAVEAFNEIMRMQV